MAAAVMTTFLAEIEGEQAIVMSHGLIGARLGISRSSVMRAIQTLQKGNWIKIIQLGASGTTNAYMVNSSVAWEGPRVGLRTAKFKATVIAFEPEQQAGSTRNNDLLLPAQNGKEEQTTERGQ